MMQKLFLFILPFFLSLFAVYSPTHAQSLEAMDQQIDAAVLKLQRNPGHRKSLLILKENYHQAQELSYDSIQSMKINMQPSYWPLIYGLYDNMTKRQQQLMLLDSVVLSSIGFIAIDWTEESLMAQRMTEKYLYAHARKMISEGEAQKALRDLEELLGISNSYQDAASLYLLACLMKSNATIFKIDNISGKKLPEYVYQELVKLVDIYSNQEISLDTRPESNKSYEKALVFLIQDVTIGPDKVSRKKTDYECNGWKSVKADILLEKESDMKCEIQLIDAQSKQVLFRQDLNTKTVFSYAYSEIKGPETCLPEAELLNLNTIEKPLPNQMDMMHDMLEKLKVQLKDVIWYPLN